MVIIDTDILILALKKDPEALKEVSELLENKAAAITPVQISEVYSFAKFEELPLIGTFFDLFTVVDFDRKTGELAGEFMQQYREFQPNLTMSDCLVGAAAAMEMYEIYTGHPQHFPMTEVKLYHKTIAAITVRSRERLANID